MNKPIVITESFIKTILSDFERDVRKMKIAGGQLTFTRKFDYGVDDRRKVNVVFTPDAYAKMVALVQSFSTEVAWHGTVQRTAPDTFLITDILVYPQVVTGAHADTDQEEYQVWMNELDDDTFNTLRFQGHSHVNMPVSPSPTDLSHQHDIISAFNKDDQFYVFMVINKRLEIDVRVYDMASNTLYENNTVDVLISGVDIDLDAFIRESRALVSTKQYSYSGSNVSSVKPATSYYGGGVYPAYCWQGDDDDVKPENGKNVKPDPMRDFMSDDGLDDDGYDDDDESAGLPKKYYERW